MEPAPGHTMPRIAGVCRMQTLPWPAVIEATCAKICSPAVPLRDRRNLEAPLPNPEPSEWAIGRLRRAHRRRTVALSAAFGRAARHERRATMDIRASDPPGAAAEAPRAGAECRAGVVAAEAATTVVDTDKSGVIMAKINSIDSNNSPRRLAWFLAAGLVVGATLLPAAPKDGQRTFATPQEAVQATIDAAEHNDTAALLQLFGPEGKDIVESGDPAEDKDSRAEFARSAHEKLQIDEDPLTPDRVTFTVGEQEWPFPVPVIRRDGKWQLDSASGRIEILARRIGRNELNAMEVCRGYAEAQLEYAAAARDGDRVLKYAQKIAATPGKRDGLYADGVPDTLVARAFAAAANPAGGKQPEPYHG